MPLTLIVTRDVAARYRGFLASVMPELAPGVYVSPDMTAAVRERVWTVMEGWWEHAPGSAVLMAYPDKSAEAVCTFAYCEGPGCEPIIFEGRVQVWFISSSPSP